MRRRVPLVSVATSLFDVQARYMGDPNSITPTTGRWLHFQIARWTLRDRRSRRLFHDRYFGLDRVGDKTVVVRGVMHFIELFRSGLLIP